MEEQCTHFLNGRFVSEAELLVSPRDVGFSRGYAVFDFLKTYEHHRPFKLEEHIARLFHSAERIGLTIPWSRTQVAQWVLDTLAANETSSEKFIKIVLSGGVSHSMLPAHEPTIMILIDPVTVYPPELYEKGIGIITVEHTRYVPDAKTNNYIEGVKRAQEAKLSGAVEPLYYSKEQVYEGSNSNVFAVMDSALYTPQHNILAGITRSVLLDILTLPIPVRVEDFTIDMLRRADEVFFTASGKEVVPVTRIDGNVVGKGDVGPITMEVIRQFRAYTASDAW